MKIELEDEIEFSKSSPKVAVTKAMGKTLVEGQDNSNPDDIQIPRFDPRHL